MSNMIKSRECYKYFDSSNIMILDDEDEGEYEICIQCHNYTTLQAMKQLEKEIDEYNKQK